MNPSASVIESALLLWALSALAGVMGTLVGLGWVRQAQSQPLLRDHWWAALVAAAALGTALCGTIVLGLSTMGWPFPLGYRLRDVPLLWLGSIAGCFAATVWLARSTTWKALAGAGALVGLLAFGLQLGWVDALGLRPGLRWNMGFMVGSALVMVAGAIWAFGMGFSESGRWGRRRGLWRASAALMLALGVIGGQQALLGGADMAAQVGSVFRREVPAALLSLAFGVVAPLAFAVMLFDLRARRYQQRRLKRREWRSRRPYFTGSGGHAAAVAAASPDGEPTEPQPLAPVAPPTAAASSAAAAAAPATDTAAPLR